MNFNRLSSTRFGVTPITRAFRPVYSSQKRFAATQAGNKGGPSRLYVCFLCCQGHILSPNQRPPIDTYYP